MFDVHRTLTETGYTTTVALLAVAFIFSPAVLIVSRPFGFVSLSLAMASSAVCATWAVIHWRKSSQHAVPSFTIPEGAAR